MTRTVENCQEYTAEQVDLRNLIHADLQFEHRGETDLKLAELQSLVTRGWMQEGDENNEFDVTDVGHEVIAATLRQQAERGDGAASDDKLMDAVQESLLEYRLRNWADESGDSLSLLDHLSAGETIQSGREEIEQMADAVCEAVAPLLRAPAEQGGRVDGAMSLDLALGYAKAACTGPMSSQAIAIIESALAQNAQGEAAAIGYAKPRELDELERIKSKARGMMGGAVAVFLADQRSEIYSEPIYLHAERARVPDGWVLVPREPTEAMGVAYLEAARIHAASGAEDAMRFSPGGYSAMLAAAPSAPEGGEVGL